jgi:SAM-dependent methyltransferase
MSPSAASFIAKAQNLYWEYRLHIATRGVLSADPKMPEHIHYGTIPYAVINNILDCLEVRREDVFVDLGCGKGRVVCCAARRTMEEVRGIEYSADLCKDAELNAAHLRGKKTKIRIIHSPAQQADYTTGTIYYMFHPFGPGVLSEVLRAMAHGLALHPRPLRIVYVNPVHEAVLRESEWLEEYLRWPPDRRKTDNHAISFWNVKLRS